MAGVLDERLRTQLALGDDLRVIPSDALARLRDGWHGATLDALDRPRRMALHEQLGADLVLAGQATTLASGRVHLVAEVRDTRDGRPRAWAEESALPDELPQLVMRLAARLRQQLKLAPPSADDEQRAQAALPASPDEAQRYVQALALLRRYDVQGARKLLEQLVQENPQQPLAWATLADAWGVLQDKQRQKEAARQAFDRSGLLPHEQRLWVEARAKEGMGDVKDAIELYRSLSTVFPDNLEYGLRLSQALRRSGRYKESLELDERLAKLPPPAGNDARLQFDLASTLAGMRDNDRALALLDQLLPRARAQGLTVLEAGAQARRCDVFYGKADIASGHVACEAAEQLYAALGDVASEARALLDHASLFVRAEHPAEGEALAERALQLYRQIGDETGIASALFSLDQTYAQMGDLKRALQHGEQCLSQAQQIDDEFWQMWCHFAVANNENDLHRLQEAEPHYREMLKRARKLDLPTLEDQGLTDYSILLAKLGRTDEQLDAAQRAVDLYRKTTPELPDLAYSLDALAQAYMTLDRLPEAQRTFEEALAIRKKVGWIGGDSEEDLAWLALYQHQPQRAETLARQALAGILSQHKASYENDYRITLMGILFHVGKSQEALRMYDDSAALARLIGKESGFAPVKAQVQAAQGEIEAATRTIADAVVKDEASGAVMDQVECLYTLGELELAAKRPSARQTLREVNALAASHHLRLVERETRELLRTLH